MLRVETEGEETAREENSRNEKPSEAESREEQRRAEKSREEKGREEKRKEEKRINGKNNLYQRCWPSTAVLVTDEMLQPFCNAGFAAPPPPSPQGQC